MRPMMLLMVCSFCLLTIGCGVDKPNSDLCIVNAPEKNRKCYNIHDDYDDNGRLKPGVKAKYRPNLSIDDLNKATVIDSPYADDHPNPNHFQDGLARVKAYIHNLRDVAK